MTTRDADISGSSEAPQAALGIDVGGTSVKGVLLRPAGVEGPDRAGSFAVVARARSQTYARPDLATLRAAVGAVIDRIAEDARTLAKAPIHLGASDPGLAVGLCVPGARDEATGRITASANLPSLVGRDPREVLGPWGARARVTTDIHASAWMVAREGNLRGRVLAVALGTGVGMAVLDEGRLLRVAGASSGHLGQIDVTLDERDAPTGPDGGRGGLEAYVGVPALRARSGLSEDRLHEAFSPGAEPFRALVRGLRIAHAIYRPDAIVLLGGIGSRLGAVAPAMHRAIADGLTSLARPGWSLSVGGTDWSAAEGAAWRSMQHPAQGP